MAVTFDAKATADTTANGVTTVSATNHTVGAGSNRALVVQLAFSLHSPTSLAVTWDFGGSAQACASIVAANGAATVARAELWGLVNPVSGAKTLKAAWTGASDVCMNGVSWTGVDQTGGVTTFPHSTSNTGSSSGGPNTQATVTVTSAVGNAVMDASCGDTGNYNSASQTSTYIDNTPTNMGAAGSRAAGAATVTLSWNETTGATNKWVSVGTDILAAGGGATTTRTAIATQNQTATSVKIAQSIRSTTQAQQAISPKSINAVRLMSQSAAATLARLRTVPRAIVTAQNSVAVLVKQAQATRVIAQASAVLMLRAVSSIRIVSQAQAASLVKSASLTIRASQGATAFISALKVALRTIVATQAQAAATVRQVDAIRLTAQASVASSLKTINAFRIISQAIAAIATPVRQAGGAIQKTIIATQASVVSVARQTQVMRLAAQAQTVALTKAVSAIRITTQASAAAASALRVLLRSVVATQAVVARAAKTVQPIRTAAQAQVAVVSRRVALSRLAQQASVVSIGKAIRKTIIALQRSIASAFGVNPAAAKPRPITMAISLDTALSFGSSLTVAMASCSVDTVSAFAVSE